jgi:hypothetical protein
MRRPGAKSAEMAPTLLRGLFPHWPTIPSATAPLWAMIVRGLFAPGSSVRVARYSDGSGDAALPTFRNRRCAGYEHCRMVFAQGRSSIAYPGRSPLFFSSVLPHHYGLFWK